MLKKMVSFNKSFTEVPTVRSFDPIKGEYYQYKKNI